LGPTAGFDLAGAERAVVELRAPHTEQAVDTNGNGRFDRLDFNVSLDLLQGGSFQWTASLYDSKGIEIEFVSGAATLATGRAVALLRFTGSKIGAHAVDGPFQVRNLLLLGPTATTIFNEVGFTQPYSYDRFEGAPARAAGPRINEGGVVSAADGQRTFAPGAIASLYGTLLAGSTMAATSTPLPRVLGGVRVTVNGVDAPLFFVSPAQINFQVPFETPATGTAAIVVIRDGASSPVGAVTMAQNAPGIFTYQRAPGAIDPVILHTDFQLVSPARPAAAGEVLIIYATGVGDLNNRPSTGAATPSSPLPVARVTPVITIGGAAAEVLFAGLAPNFVGLVQFNVRTPATLPAGATLPLVIRFGSAASQPVNLIVRAGAPPPPPPPPSSGADVGITLLNVWPRTMIDSDNLTVLFRILNNSRSSGQATYRVYLSSDPVISPATDRLITSGTTNLTGPDTTVTLNRALPPGVPPGSYHVGVSISFPGDTNSANDVSVGLPVAVVAVRPPFDLAVRILSVSPTTVAAGGSVQVAVTVTAPNQLSGTFYREIYLSRDSTITEQDTFLDDDDFDMRDGTDTRIFFVNIPRNTPPGSYFIGVIVESDRDTNPSNNTSAGVPITVTAP